MDTKSLIIISLFIGGIVLLFLLTALHVGEGLERDSLLYFTCRELKGKISQDGTDGRFVTDWSSLGNWVSDDLKRDAMEFKGCINTSTDKFDYRSGGK